MSARKFQIVLAVLTLALGLAGCKKSAPTDAGTAAEGQEQKTITLNYANFPPAPTFPCVQMERWAKEVAERTNGRVKINTFPGGTLLGAKDMFDGVVNGQSDIGCLCMAYQPGRFTVTNATSLPLGIPNAKVGSQILLDIYKNYQPEAFANVKVLAMFTTAPSNIMSKKPVRSLEDIQGMNLRASGGAAQILKAWGANQVGMPMSETPEALQKNVVEGLFSSLEVMKDFKYAELCKYVTMTDTVIYPFAVVMNQQKWDSLPDDVKEVMNDMVDEQSLWTGEYMDEHVKEANKWSKTEQNVEFITLDAEQKKLWDVKLKPIIDQWVSENTPGLPAEEIVAFIRDGINKYGQDDAQ